MKITISQLRRIIREEVERVAEGSLPFDGVFNPVTGEMLDMVDVPMNMVDVPMNKVNQNQKKVFDGKEYFAFTGTDDEFDELVREVNRLSTRKPKKWLAPFQINAINALHKR